MEEDRIKRYEPLWNNWYVEQLIGEGSFGQVYRIKREEFGTTYQSALKIISIPKAESELKQFYVEGMTKKDTQSYFRGIVEEIYDEIVLMSKLKGKSNIVSYEDHQIIEREDKIGYDIFIRMELLTSLSDYALRHALSTQEIVKMGKDICQALMICGRQNILHRDIKPDNIFISEDGDFKLGDFGIARKVENYQIGLSIKGSYEYMAPEVYKGKEYNGRVDIYSLGIVLYSFLNNRKIPFIPQDTQAVSYTQRQEALQRRLQGEQIPKPVLASEELGDVILKAIAYKPEERYESAEEFFKALASLSVEDCMSSSAIEQEMDLDGTVVLPINEETLDFGMPKKEEKLGQTVCLAPLEEDLDGTMLLSNMQMGASQNKQVEQGSNHTEEQIKGNNNHLNDSNVSNHSNQKNDQKGNKNKVLLVIVIAVALIGTVIIAWLVLSKKENGNADNVTITASPNVVETDMPTEVPTEAPTEAPTEVPTDTPKKEPITIEANNKKLKSLEEIKELNESNIDAVTELSIHQNKIKDISILGLAVQLEYLDMEENSVSDISSLAGLDGLSYLNLSNNQLNDITPLSDLENLKELLLSDNQIEEIKVLSGLNKLEVLRLQNNKIKKIDSIGKLTALEHLDISGNSGIKDISILKNLKKLTYLGLENTGVTESQINNLKKALPKCTIIGSDGTLY